jgi:predicted extracellular nuclease
MLNVELIYNCLIMNVLGKFIFCLGIAGCLFLGSWAQEVQVVFYNVENLCDTEDDPSTKDEEFLPQGEKNWTMERFRRKTVHIYQVLVAMSAGEMPGIVGLCEIENREVLNRLIYDTPLIRADYHVIQRDSPDARGMDVALLYRPDIFMPDTTAWLEVPMTGNETTREILKAKGKLWGEIPVCIYVNHWPSRFSGAGSSSPKRVAAASILSASIKEELQSNPGANIIVMGDFNDEPGDESLQAIGKILGNATPDKRYSLVNLSVKTSLADIEGTIKHQGTWCIFDQVLVSEAIFNGTTGCNLNLAKTEVFRGDFLLEPDQTYTGQKPFRTYSGPAWRDGFSDHLPVSIRIRKIGTLP